MKPEIKGFEAKTIALKAARLQLLKLHKILIDLERERFERKNGVLTSGQFLNLLINESDFQWLRKFSSLIVEIDEMLDLDDGFSEEAVDNHLTAMRKLITLDGQNGEFDERYKNSIQNDPQVALKHGELVKFLS